MPSNPLYQKGDIYFDTQRGEHMLVVRAQQGDKSGQWYYTVHPLPDTVTVPEETIYGHIKRREDAVLRPYRR